MTIQKLKTIEMTRRIRDQHYAQLKDKTHADRIAFYQQQAQKLHERLRVSLQAPSEEESNPV